MLSGFIKSINEKNIEVESVHVYSEKLGVFEHTFISNLRRHLFSGSKAFTSMAVGIAEGENLLSLDDKVLDYFPQFKDKASAGSEKITVKNLLQMCAGHSVPLYNTDSPPSRYNEDWAGLFFEMKLDTEPGTSFYYDNGATYMLSRVVEAASGEKLSEFLKPRLFTPLGITDIKWDECHGGHSLGAVGLHLTTEEFSRLGILMLNEGVCNGKQIVPTDYIRRASTDTVTVKYFGDPENNEGYGYQLWRCTVDAYRADGKYGQYSIVLPKNRAVVTITSRRENNANDALREVWAEILPKL